MQGHQRLRGEHRVLRPDTNVKAGDREQVRLEQLLGIPVCLIAKVFFFPRIVEATGSIMISTCDDYDVIAGQGTLGLELLHQVMFVNYRCC